ncbi:hypothetical protein JOM56_014462 [Amanita muscaria]
MIPPVIQQFAFHSPPLLYYIHCFKCMSLSPHVEALAQKQSKYINLFELCANDLRKNITQGKEAYDRVLQEWDVLLKPGERPSLTHQEPKALQKAMEEICSMEPRSLEDHVKIMSAARAMTNSIILYDMRNLTDNEQSQVNKRVTQLWCRSPSHRYICIAAKSGI